MALACADSSTRLRIFCDSRKSRLVPRKLSFPSSCSCFDNSLVCKEIGKWSGFKGVDSSMKVDLTLLYGENSSIKCIGESLQRKTEGNQIVWKGDAFESYSFSRRTAMAVFLGSWFSMAQAAGARGAAEEAAERALMAALNGRDLLKLLASNNVDSSLELQQWLRAVSAVSESLAVNLPLLIELYEVDSKTVDEISVALESVQDSLWKPQIVIGSTQISTFGKSRFEKALKLIQLSYRHIEWLLVQIPEEDIELAQLARGVRRMV